MSVEEHIDYYARVKGISAKEKKALIEDVIKELGLESHRDKEAGNLSGGNKRKLSVAIAIIGNPQITKVYVAGHRENIKREDICSYPNNSLDGGSRSSEHKDGHYGERRHL